MKKFNIKNIDTGKIAGVLVAVLVGVSAFTNSIASQKKDEEFKDMKERIAKLESK